MAEEVKEVKKESKVGDVQKSLTRFFKDVKSELKKVIWPTWTQLRNNTMTVFVMCLIVGAIIWIFDFGLLKASEWAFFK